MTANSDGGAERTERVAVLPAAVANQIAAGEVVERPASVVKELVENALDAGATSVFIEVEDGGRRLVRVVDDGHGMGSEDARLSVQRHATSKIRSHEDLAAIATLGFRGEALPSIASVSRFNLRTRDSRDAPATEVVVEGGAPAQVGEASGPIGTRIEVADLFYNVPARLKFLKRKATEMGHVRGLITAFSLGHPHVHFRLTSDGRKTLEHPASTSIKGRIFQVLGKATTGRLHEVRLDGPVRVRGFISEPGLSRTNQQGMHTFVNGRAVRDRVVNHAVVSAYGELLDRGRHPVAVIYVHLPADEVDVNVHPTKAEVRFVRRAEVHDAIVRACRITLNGAPWLHRPAAPVYGSAGGEPAPLGLAEPGPAAGPAGAVSGSHLRPTGPAPAPVRPRQVLTFVDPTAPVGGAVSRGPFGRMGLVGQSARGWLVLEDEEGLWAVDPTAARGRMLARRLGGQWRRGEVGRQPLLIPAQVEFTRGEEVRAGIHRELLGTLGLEMEPFGGTTWQVCCVPIVLARVAPEAIVKEALAALGDKAGDGAVTPAFFLRLTGLIPPGQAPMTQEAIRALLDALDEDGVLPPDVGSRVASFEALAKGRGAP